MIFGYNDKVKTFKKLAESGSLRHAYLFFGQPQVGKFTFARHLAYFLEFSEFEVTGRTLTDAVFVGSDDGTIGIDDIRDLKTPIHQRPFNSSRKLIVVDNAENLTIQAQSALLKFVEEAPKFTVFIFIAKDPQVLLPPLASRLMYVYFSTMSGGDLTRILVEEYGVNLDRAEEIAKKSFGRMGRALDIMDTSEKKSAEDMDLEDYISEKIVNTYLSDKIKNSEDLKWLLDRESKVRRFNVNKKLQKKAVDYRLNR